MEWLTVFKCKCLNKFFKKHKKHEMQSQFEHLVTQITQKSKHFVYIYPVNLILASITTVIFARVNMLKKPITGPVIHKQNNFYFNIGHSLCNQGICVIREFVNSLNSFRKFTKSLNDLVNSQIGNQLCCVLLKANLFI